MGRDNEQTPPQRAVGPVADELATVERRIGELIEGDAEALGAVARHLIGAGGKRVRPMVTLLAARAIDFPRRPACEIAAIAELIHTATLLHDDVVDEGALRRGRPTARLAFGNGPAVLAGDYLLARALSAVAALDDQRAVRSLADTVGALAQGENMQLERAGDVTTTAADHRRVVACKTAALFAWCSTIGGLVEADEPRGALMQYGLAFGSAFQLADDALDFMHDGLQRKDVGQDLAEGKLTMPVLLAIEREPTLRTRLADWLAAGRPAAALAGLMDAVVAAGGVAAALQEATALATDARAALSALPSNDARDALASLADDVVARQRRRLQAPVTG